MVAKSWKLSTGRPQPEPRKALGKPKRRPVTKKDGKVLKRKPSSAVVFRPGKGETEEEATPLQQLIHTVDEKDPFSLERGTKRALVAGSNAFASKAAAQFWDPKLQPPGGAFTLKALVDPWGRLKDCTAGQIYWGCLILFSSHCCF